ncbi:serine protease filzig isoform X2 [Eurosta solidaginis]
MRLSAFPPPACDTAKYNTAMTNAITAAATNQTRTSNRNSTSNALNNYNTNNAIKQTKINRHITTTKLTTETCKEDAFRKAAEQNYKEHLHTNTTNLTNSNRSLWQALKSDAASLLPLLAFLLLLNCTATPTQATPVFVDNPSLAQFQSGRNIRHLPCIVRKSGRSGICMFAIDCIKQNGTHLGTCIDRFYFGSCCQLKDDAALFAPEISDNSIDANTISHFPHESTTLPTSTLFKLTTLDPHHTVQNSSNSISETVRNVTQSYLQQHGSTYNMSSSSSSPSSSSYNNKVDTTPTSTSNSTKPIKLTTTNAPRQPPAHTTHKNSQFVVRTTPKPTVAPTTIKPPRRKTTMARPVLTTTERPQLDTLIEVTTQPTKFVTFQIVETTTPTATGTNIKLDELPNTQRPLLTTNRYRPRPATTEVPTKIFTTTPKQPEPVKITTRPKPIITRRPITSSRPQQSRPRPSVSVKPTRRPPVENNVNESVKPVFLNLTTTDSNTGSTIYRRPTPTPTTVVILNNDEVLTTMVETKVPLPSESLAQTTHAPRPRPKPTAEIVKVPIPTIDVAASTTSSAEPKTTTTTTTSVPTIIRSTTQKPSMSIKTKPTTESSAATSLTTTTEKEAENPPKGTSVGTNTKVPISSTTPQSATLTTETAKVESPVSLEITTLIPGLITWTNEENEPTTMNATVEWVSESNIFNLDRITESAGPNAETASTRPPPTTSTMISVETSISEIIGSISLIMPKPERPSSVVTQPPKPQAKPTENPVPVTTTAPITTVNIPTTTRTTTAAPSTTTTTTTTPKPPPKATAPSKISTSSTTTTTTSAPPKTESSIELGELSSSTSAEIATEGFSTTGGIFGTTEYSTEDYNGTFGSSAPAPVNALEGVDYRQICGRRMFPEPRIVGGSNAAFGRWPWQISLRQWRTSTYLHKCGAALLNENWAITAAHCVENVPPSDLLLRMGEYDLAEEEEPYGYQERRVQIVASHPQFDARTFEYDLALLRFYEPVVFQPNIIPVCVPNSDIDFVGQTAFVTGWGRLYENGPLPSVLQEVAVPVINNTICETMYRVAGFIEHIPHIFICAGWKKGGYDSCEGDSGGPMVLQREDDKRFQLGGVISWGIGCAEANQPGVYTRISEFRDWINQILQF